MKMREIGIKFKIRLVAICRENSMNIRTNIHIYAKCLETTPRKSLPKRPTTICCSIVTSNTTP